MRSTQQIVRDGMIIGSNFVTGMAAFAAFAGAGPGTEGGRDGGRG